MIPRVKPRYLLTLLMIWTEAGWADFSDTEMQLHPLLPFSDPYIIELKGDWPTDCHPGEQKPVIREYTGDTIIIGFDIIVDHVTCNDVVTPYRVLVDVSDVLDEVDEHFEEVAVTVRYAGAEFQDSAILFCICSPQPHGPSVRPEAGLYDSVQLQKQGLLLARQNQRLAVYPLVFDELGDSEWLFGGGGIVEDTYFADLYELDNGQCLGCPPPGSPPQMNVVGKVSMLMDSEGLLQVKVNDGLFVQYEQSRFGYSNIEVSEDPPLSLVDLSGRWAVVNAKELPPQIPEPESTETFPPMVFSLSRKTIFDPPPGSLTYSLRNVLLREEVAEMLCQYVHTQGNTGIGRMRCSVYDADINAGEDLYQVTQRSLDRLLFEWVGPIIPEFGTPDPLSVVRID